MSDGAGFAGQVGLLAAGGVLTLGGSLVTTWLTDLRRFKREDAVREEAAKREDKLRAEERQHQLGIAERQRFEQEKALLLEKRYEEEQRETQRLLTLEAASAVHLETAYGLVCQMIVRNQREAAGW
ncbi:hypothetical protein [Leucobacter chironomi]|uniref:hypothetical protein n=1 Tax=Leucobacter chironomi TaxID=491918 RepID=UPI0012678C7F|nr:hypothetical protein [Leucobacter chironomi]